MLSQNIASLADVGSLQNDDQIPLARSGATYSVKGNQFASRSQLDAANSRINGINVSHGAHVGAITSNGLQTSYSGVVPAEKGGAGTVNGILRANGFGNVAAASSGVNYVAPVQLELKLTKPSSASNNQLLTYSSGQWIAADPPTGGGGGSIPVNYIGDVASTGSATTYNNVVPFAKGGAGGLAQGLMKCNGNGSTSTAVVGTDYIIPSVLSNYATLSMLNNKLDRPSSAVAGDVLTFDGNAWVAKKLN
jgi:hypothetical protein